MSEATPQPKVYLTQRLQTPVMERVFGQYDAYCPDRKPTRDELMEGVRGKDGLICLLTDKIRSRVIRQNPNLKVISTVSVGYDHIDVDYATSLGIPVTNTPGVLTVTTAEHAILLMSAVGRNLIPAVTDLRRRRAKSWRLEDDYLGVDLHGSTIGIVGFGKIGQEVGRIAAMGYRMNVLYYQRNELSNLKYQELGYTPKYVPLDTLLRDSDFVSVHVPKKPETNNLIGARELELMKRTAILVNTSRATVVDEEALIRALEQGVISGAGIDVFRNEPRIDRRLLKFPNFIGTPHIGSSSKVTRMNMANLAVDNLDAVILRNNPQNVVNPDYQRHSRYARG